ncbi:RtcB family protein [Alkalibacter mobilis]|uniref:RtcB family protein n=1 Tax=Alkalibacter mobilis TaxID=2787712 RepID=UPI00189C92E8|nr:RtcB family protein [Alkalibacter mobilis]MBF7097760.1 RtcB family protein [Alkalibacter mobilis]
MFTIYDPNEQKWPIKVWLEDVKQIEAVCLKQAKNLSNLPFIHKWVALMPDTHSGYGMPIGGVIGTEKVIIPNAVGVDIGCGINYIQTDIPIKPLLSIDTPNGKLAQAIVGDILRNLPTGFEHHKKRQECKVIDDFLADMKKSEIGSDPEELLKELESAYYQVGTLGGGNHFIELQTDDSGYLGLMVHSGSRNLGKKICDHFNNKAIELNKSDDLSIPAEWDLAYLTTESEIGKQYIRWMNLALDFAKENRSRMMDLVVEKVKILTEKYAGINKVELSNKINCHHNYASFEEHYGKMVWVHRKGAIRAGKGELGIIPGAMGSYSYLVVGKGNPESFLSCSHGAGRRMSRSEAKAKYSVQDTVFDLKSLGVFLGKQKRSDIGEESRFAYKDIQSVIENELDLIDPIHRLKTIAVIKG